MYVVIISRGEANKRGRIGLEGIRRRRFPQRIDGRPGVDHGASPLPRAARSGVNRGYFPSVGPGKANFVVVGDFLFSFSEVFRVL